MTPELQQRLEELLDQALDLPSPQRQAFVDRECQNDPELRGEVLSLLAHFEQAGAQGLTGPLVSPLFVPRQAGPADELVGQTVGAYRVEHRIGGGGFGTVYRAARADGQFREHVAIKVLKRGLETAEIVGRFHAERQTLAVLRDHPNVVTLFDGGSTPDGRPYFVMEHVDGRPLDEYCDAHKLSIGERLRLFRTACAAVHHAHQHLVVHRDLKPGNILALRAAGPDGHTVKLLDFGIAKLLDPGLAGGGALATRPGQRFLTPAYASPEQVRGGPIAVTSDVYSLGVVLYELLTGHRPYRIERAADVEKLVCEQDPEKPSTKVASTEEVQTDGGPLRITPQYVSERRNAGPAKLHRQLAGDLDNIVLKALRKEPGQRYQSVAEFSQDIQNYLDGNPVAARGNPLGYRARKFAWKHKGKLAAAALVFAALAGLAGWALAERGVAEDKRAEAEANERAARKAEAEADQRRLREERLRDLAERFAYGANLGRAQDAFARGDTKQALAQLQKDLPEGGLQKLRGFEWYYFWERCQGGARVLAEPADGVLGVAFAAGRVAALCKGKKVLVWDNLAEGKQPSTLDLPVEMQSLALSADGKLLAVGGSDAGLLYRLDKDDEPTPLKGGIRLKGMTFSPDGKLLAWGDGEGRIHLWEIEGAAKPQQLKRPEKHRVDALAFSPDGKSLACIYTDKSLRGEVRVWDLAERKIGDPLDEPAKGVAALTVSPDGRTLVWSRKESVILCDLATGQKRFLPQGHQGPITSLALTQDGKRLATGSQDTTVKVSDVATGEELFTLRGHTAPVTSVAFDQADPRGRALVSGSTDAKKPVILWDAGHPPERPPLLGPGLRVAVVRAVLGLPPAVAGAEDRTVYAAAFSPDGKKLASGSAGGQVMVCDWASGKTLAAWQAHNVFVYAVLFDPLGDKLVTAGADRSDGRPRGTVRVWEAATGKLLKELRAHGATCYCLAFSPDGKVLASGESNGTVELWDLSSWKSQTLASANVGHAKEREVRSVAFAPDGRKLAAGCWNGSVMLWDVDTRDLERTLSGHDQRVWSVAFAPDGKTLATAGHDGTVRLWDAATGNETHKLTGHVGDVFTVVFSSDGRDLASGGRDGMVKLWDHVIGQERATLPGTFSVVLCLTFSPDGTRLASGRTDGTLRLWSTAHRDRR